MLVPRPKVTYILLDLEVRFRKRLAMWKRQYISKGERITLIRSTLSNLLIYFMSIFQLPRAVRMRLEKIQRDFLWGGGALEQKPHLVRWSIVCEAKVKAFWGLRTLVCSIRLSLASGHGDLQTKKRPFGIKWLEGSTGRKEGGDLVRLGRPMELVCGKL